ncbi:MAG: hypothetical protein JNK34_10175, partial [Tabrizicola sp.]|nr:hypothetical protein [Tabrizicola sp.]
LVSVSTVMLCLAMVPPALLKGVVRGGGLRARADRALMALAAAWVAINNAWRIRPDWTHAIHAWDFPTDRHPIAAPGQALVTEDDFVPAQNAYGGFVYAGATMAFTAAYWALKALRPDVIATFGCDMHYPATGPTHFYGAGQADPLRPDISLRSLEAKSARLMVLAARQGCAMVNLSTGPSRLVFPRSTSAEAATAGPLVFSDAAAAKALTREAELSYDTPTGRYWEELQRFDPDEIDRLDALWLAAAKPMTA